MKTSVKLSQTGQIAGEGELVPESGSTVFLIDNQTNKPLSFFGKFPIFFDGISLFATEGMVINFDDLAVTEEIGVQIVGIDL